MPKRNFFHLFRGSQFRNGRENQTTLSKPHKSSVKFSFTTICLSGIFMNYLDPKVNTHASVFPLYRQANNNLRVCKFFFFYKSFDSVSRYNRYVKVFSAIQCQGTNNDIYQHHQKWFLITPFHNILFLRNHKCVLVT